MKSMWTLLIIISCTATSCNNENKYEIIPSDKYEKSKSSMAEMEQKSPASFLTVTGSKKKNLLGQTVVNGTIFNKARVVTYKDIEIKLSFYSKTGTLLEEDKEVVYEAIHPGGSKRFKSKYFTPKGTDSVAMKIAGAKY